MKSHSFILALGLVLAMQARPALAQERKTLFEKESQYHYIVVEEDSQGIRSMRFRRKGRDYDESQVDSRNPYVPMLTYTRLFFSAFLLCPEAKRVLMVGLGGGSVPTLIRKYFPEVSVVTVELDPAVVKAAQGHFFFKPDERNEVVVRDGRVQVRVFLKKNEKFDIVMLDAFRGGYIPYHLTTKEYMEQCRDLLTDGGVVAANMRPDFKIYDYHKRTLAAVFPSLFTFGKEGNKICVGMPSKRWIGAGELRLVAMKLQSGRALPFRLMELVDAYDTSTDYETAGEIFTDDYAPANVLRGIPRE